VWGGFTQGGAPLAPGWYVAAPFGAPEVGSKLAVQVEVPVGKRSAISPALRAVVGGLRGRCGREPRPTSRPAVWGGWQEKRKKGRVNETKNRPLRRLCGRRLCSIVVRY
jgi:hypothetical protein